MIKTAIAGSLMIAVILLVRRLFGKKLPKFSLKLLWILAAIRLIVPFWFDVEVKVPCEPGDVSETQSAVVYTVPVTGTSDKPTFVAVPEQNTVDAADIFRFVHMAGALIIGGFIVSAYIRMRRHALRAKPVDTVSVGRKRKALLVSGEEYSSPFSCGIVKPIIYIPTNMLSLDTCQLDTVMTHELSHIRSFDQAVKWLVAAAVCLNWYNPLAWVMLTFATRDIELACDEAVVQKMGSRAEYAMTLIAAEEMRSVSAVCSFGAPSLNERIEFIMKSKKTTLFGFIAAGAVLSLMTVFFVSVNAVENVAPENTQLVAPMDFGTEESATDRDCEVTECEEWYEEPAYETVAEELVFEVTTVEAPLYAEEELVPPFVFALPLDEYGAVTGRFGYETNPAGITVFNNGINLSAEEGTAVKAVSDGEVIYAGYSADGGNSVAIDHGNGFVTCYGHLKAINCEEGDMLLRGDKLGEVGSTGKATGPNLFFAMELQGSFIDPMMFVK